MIKEPPKPAPELRLLEVTERLHATMDEVHPGWIRATAILLRGMERLRLQEATQQSEKAKLPA